MGLLENIKEQLRDLFADKGTGLEMEERDSDSRTIKRRYRRAAERIYENSSLRDELNDEQAKRLLDWGNSYLKKVADETAELADEDAETVLDEKTEQVSNVMRQVNQLTKSVAVGDSQEMSAQLRALRKGIDGLKDVSGDSSAELEQVTDLSEAERSQVFESLMSVLDGEEE